jgi:hypothetical protein
MPCEAPSTSSSRLRLEIRIRTHTPRIIGPRRERTAAKARGFTAALGERLRAR